ncbi:MAG: 1-phosphofructokinase [Brevinema sp.]
MLNMNSIYTLTMNPAIDLFISMDDLKPYVVNRTNSETYQENGKAVNISRVLKRMGIDSVALGFLGGFSGKFIQDRLQALHIGTDFVEINGTTRINVFLKAEHEYKIVNKGPSILRASLEQLFDKIKEIPQNSVLFISGSLPLGIDFDVYHRIFSLIKGKNIKLALDISDSRLVQLCPYKFFIIKPNREELAHYFNIDQALDVEAVIFYGRKLLELGCQRVIVSLDVDGLIYLDSSRTIHVNAPQGTVVNTTCAGDTLLATFIGKTLLGHSLEDSLIFASASASSTAFTEDITDFADVEKLSSQIKITEM